VYPGAVTDQGSGQPHLTIGVEQLQTLVEVLQRQMNWRIGLVGHDYHSANVEQQQKYSQVYAEQLRAALIKSGISADRLQAYGFGGLAPAGRGDLSARVEVVLLP
jgi:outer membrane protein OmpA-like peptidoglycan-associated protein